MRVAAVWCTVGQCTGLARDTDLVVGVGVVGVGSVGNGVVVTSSSGGWLCSRHACSLCVYVTWLRARQAITEIGVSIANECVCVCVCVVCQPSMGIL